MIGDAFVSVSCDRCMAETDPITLCALAGGGWDERTVKSDLLAMGWRVTGTETICAECVEDEDREKDDEATRHNNTATS